MITYYENSLKLDSKGSSIVIGTSKLNAELLYIGKKINDIKGNFLSTDDNKFHASADDTTFYNSLYSFNGDGNNRESALLLYGKNGEIIHRFVFDKVETVKVKKPDHLPHARKIKETVCVSYKCLNAKLTFKQYVATTQNSDAFVFWTELVNEGEDYVNINRMMSVQLDLYSSKETLYTFNGAWMRERHKTAHPLECGVFYVDSKIGASSNIHNPYVFLESEAYGYIAINLIYSGNHKEIVEKTTMGRTKIMSGINDYAFHYTLKKGETFTAPEAVVVVGDTTQEITTKMHEFVNESIIPERFKNVERPILINNWEATYFDFNYDKLIAIADRASQLGIELFVLDDGWFGDRKDDFRALGDWYDNVQKTGGLAKLKKAFKERGMKFGLWIEPEMINADSNLYRAHPEYAMTIPGMTPIEKRNQLMLDLTNDTVVDAVLEMLYNVIDEVHPDYIKWDYNRQITDAFSPVLENQGEYFYKYTLGVYKMFNAMTSRYPEILFEGCSSGGNRFDLGMLYYTPQIWCSDDTDARERAYIQEGTLYAYPQSTMGAHVSISPNHGTQNSTSPDDRFNIACIGAFGYELDLSRIDEEELALYKEQVSFYKKHRKLLQFGDYYRLTDLFNNDQGGWVIVSPDKKKAIAMILETSITVNKVTKRFKLKGLDPDKKYSVSMRVQDKDKNVDDFEAYGDVLMSGLIDFGDIPTQTNRAKYSNSIASRLIVLNQVK